MAVSGNLTTVEKLRTMLKMPAMDDADPYALLIIEAASQAVRDYARQLGWVTRESGDTLGTGQVDAPETAQQITLWLAIRAYTNPTNLQRRTAGPISDTYFENGVYGLELTEDEKSRLGDLRTDGGGGLWVQPLSSGEETGPILIPSSREIPGDPFYIADGWQFPYGRP